MFHISFCIRTSGERNDMLSGLLKSIAAQQIPKTHYEMLVCGDTNLSPEKYGFRFIEAKDEAHHCRLGKMCNILADNSKYEILCYLDDDSKLKEGWWNAVRLISREGWDLTPFRLLNFDGRRWYDWAENKDGILRKKDWDETADEHTYIGGGSLLVKKEVALKVKFKDMGRDEDPNFSKDAFLQGYILRTYPELEKAVVIHFLDPRGRNKFESDSQDKINIPNVKIDITIPTMKELPELRGMISDIEENSYLPHRIIASCQRVSAAKNRNLCLDLAKTDILIMIDDDVQGFFPGWDVELIKPLLIDSKVYATTARILNPDMTYGPMCGVDIDLDSRKGDYTIVPKRIDVVMPSMAMAMRKTDLRYDEYYKGSGFEDNDFLFQCFFKDKSIKFVVVNRCKLIHIREMKNQAVNFIFNRDYFYKKWGMEDYPYKPKW